MTGSVQFSVCLVWRSLCPACVLLVKKYDSDGTTRGVGIYLSRYLYIARRTIPTLSRASGETIIGRWPSWWSAFIHSSPSSRPGLFYALMSLH
ncbi:hypothetical protein F5B22DRAFT_603849, partial [Xylaria bambusicola]|uniref:uncharacterized protein n=1 Tax=Xylaria bambusicola TaxID=326684 RepID=UPI002007C9C4